MKGIWTSKWSWVAIGLAAFAIGFGLFRLLRTSSRERRIAEYVVAFPVPTSAMPEDGALNWIEGVMAYQRKEYAAARESWEKSLALGEQGEHLSFTVFQGLGGSVDSMRSRAGSTSR